MSAASGGNSEPKQGQRSQSARGFCPRSTMRVPQPDIIEHFGNADAVPQPPERCLSRKAGIVRCCHKERTNEKYSGNSCTNDGERQPNNRQHKSTPCTKSTMLSGAGGVVVQFSRSAKTINPPRKKIMYVCRFFAPAGRSKPGRGAKTEQHHRVAYPALAAGTRLRQAAGTRNGETKIKRLNTGGRPQNGRVRLPSWPGSARCKWALHRGSGHRTGSRVSG